MATTKEENWQIKRRADTCAGTGIPFGDGEEIITRLLLSDGEYLREDYSLACWEEQNLDHGLSAWKSIFHAPPPPAEVVKKESVETLLRTLIDKEDPDDINAIYILSIMLERKKILVEKSVQIKDDQTKVRVYEHKKNGDTFFVVDPELKLAEIETVQEEVIGLLGGKPPKTATVFHFEAVLRNLLQKENKLLFPRRPTGGDAGIAQHLAGAFLVLLSGKKNPRYTDAEQTFLRFEHQQDWKSTVSFFRIMLDSIALEIRGRGIENASFSEELAELATSIELKDGDLWPALFPEGSGIRGDEPARIKALRDRRTVDIDTLCPDPITNPAEELLFTSNVLLTIPSRSTSIDNLPYSDALKTSLKTAAAEKQQYWFDHPIQIGVKPENNELLYGLRGLAKTLAFEKEHGTAPAEARLTCVLSVTVTHESLHAVTRDYIREELAAQGAPEGLDLFAFTETDTRALIEEVLAPAAETFFGTKQAAELLSIIGVDGEYGRHYSFLKAVASLWQVVCNHSLKGTFKIDLDQIFPQENLKEETGKSAFEHFSSPLWGARAHDVSGQPIELGMIAGSLVNEADIGSGLFTPDVTFPTGKLAPDEQIFFSRLPQALSTEAEMTARYDDGPLNGKTRALQRIHVTGGTNGIRVDALRRHRPFTPSFIGRAEDQAYLLSVLGHTGDRLAYAHASGLIMRHDKDAFAAEAIQSAKSGTIIGDYVRTLYFSAYARELNKNVDQIKDVINPFTGAFVSHIPQTVVTLRLALKTLTLIAEQQHDTAVTLLQSGTERLNRAVQFTGGGESELTQHLARERKAWNLFYDTLDALETAIAKGDAFAENLKTKARDLIEKTRI
ncbi:MAG: hypothetical protein OEL75_00155 [Kiritimatiellaceae bacterium]|nr:hypothetical protein [Kiritimatiellaceae bacterium]